VFLLAAVSGILAAMLLPIGGAVPKVMVDSFQGLVTKSTLKLPADVTALTYSFNVALVTLAPVYPEGTEERSKRTNVAAPGVCTIKFALLPKLLFGCAETTYASSLGMFWARLGTAANAITTQANMLPRHLPAQICTRALVIVVIFAP
jgi:hypothetical protein